MKAYILSIIGATLISALSGILAPDKWRKYIGVITGFVIISCIISPIASITHTQLFKGFDEVEEGAQYSNDMQIDMVREELERRVCEDIEKRLLEEFRIRIKADCDISINENREIIGIDRIYIKGTHLDKTAEARLCSVYGVTTGEIVYK